LRMKTDRWKVRYEAHGDGGSVFMYVSVVEQLAATPIQLMTFRSAGAKQSCVRKGM